jgi:hypothetical protein
MRKESAITKWTSSSLYNFVAYARHQLCGWSLKLRRYLKHDVMGKAWARPQVAEFAVPKWPRFEAGT